MPFVAAICSRGGEFRKQPLPSSKFIGRFAGCLLACLARSFGSRTADLHGQQGVAVVAGAEARAGGGHGSAESVVGGEPGVVAHEGGGGGGEGALVQSGGALRRQPRLELLAALLRPGDLTKRERTRAICKGREREGGGDDKGRRARK